MNNEELEEAIESLKNELSNVRLEASSAKSRAGRLGEILKDFSELKDFSKLAEDLHSEGY